MMDRENLDWTHSNNTLIISVSMMSECIDRCPYCMSLFTLFEYAIFTALQYEKPRQIREHEEKMRCELEVMKQQKRPEDGDVQCPTQ